MDEVIDDWGVDLVGKPKFTPQQKAEVTQEAREYVNAYWPEILQSYKDHNLQ